MSPIRPRSFDFSPPPPLPQTSMAKPLHHQGIILKPKKNSQDEAQIIINAFPQDVEAVREQTKHIKGAHVRTVSWPDDQNETPDVLAAGDGMLEPPIDEFKELSLKKVPTNASPKKPKLPTSKPRALRTTDVELVAGSSMKGIRLTPSMLRKIKAKRYKAECEVYHITSNDMKKLEDSMFDDDDPQDPQDSFCWDYDFECQVLDMLDIYDDNEQYEYTKAVFTKRDQAYIALLDCVDFPLSFALAHHRLPALIPISTAIPKHEYQPVFPRTGFTQFNGPLPRIHIKRPNLLCHGLGDDTTNTIILAEAAFYENAKTFPHPNIAVYHGCKVNKGCITGLCFRRYKEDLNDRIIRLVEKGPLPQHCIDKWLAQIRAGIQHIHALGFTHNDINPTNIMFDEESDVPVIIDFDSAARIGSKLLKSGTEGWMPEKPFAKAEEDNDFLGLKMIGEFMDGFREVEEGDKEGEMWK